MELENMTGPVPQVGSSAAPVPAPQPIQRVRSWDWVGQVLSNRKALFGVAILVILIVIAILAPLIAPGDPLAPDYSSAPMTAPSASHPFGTDQQSRDIFRQMVDGTRPTLFIGFSVALVGTLLGLIGMVGGYAGGWFDEVISLVTNIFLVIPAFPLVIVISSWIQVKNDIPMILVIGLTSWAFGARVLRSQTLSLRQRDYVQAAIVSGEAHWRIILTEILPNMTSLVVSGFIGLVITAMGSAAGIFFLGLGNISGEANWFTVLYWAQNSSALQQGAWWDFAIPGLAIALVAVACALINYGIDEVSNPRLGASRIKAARRATASTLDTVGGGGSIMTSQRTATLTTSTRIDASDSTLLEVRDLTVDYLTPRGPARAVDHVSFSIARGEVFGLAGESGCGKTTIAHAVMRLIKPPGQITGGHMLFHGRDIVAMPPAELQDFRWRRVSIVFQSAMNALNPVITLGAQLCDAMLAHQKMSKSQAWERAAEMFALVGIESHRLKSFPHELSGGMRQRAVIAMALALSPALIIMDEPTTALDVVVQRDILQQIEDLQAQFGFSILFITHDLSLLVEFGTRLAIMYAGRIVELAPANELFIQPLHPYTVGLMNSFPSISGEKKALQGIAGTPPDLVAPPPGCRFAPRCAHIMTECGRVYPPLRELSPGHWAACHMYADGGTKHATAE